jgi:hypothetical protein
MDKGTQSIDLTRENLAAQISDLWTSWDQNRYEWKNEKKELRQFIFATDTRKTSVDKSTSWKNSTVTPKLTQIRDNLHANYLSALFPSSNWLRYEGGDAEDVALEKVDKVEGYMRTKLREGNFESIVSELVLDYIDYGNVFVGHNYCDDKFEDPVTGESTSVYQGPKPYRISPLDIVFNPTLRSFEQSPKIVRSVRSVADFLREWKERPNPDYDAEVVAKVRAIRSASGTNVEEVIKDDGYTVDGFGTLHEYLKSPNIEVLEFYGDLYDPENDDLLVQHLITVVDRRWVLRKEPIKTHYGRVPIFHVGWRQRPDNLWAQGPLDQLLGLQYRIDHLENLKADVFDQIAHPVCKVSGSTVEDFEFGPGEVIYTGTDGDVVFERPDATALNADTQIQNLMDKMEELAGAPRQAMGIRTPGEKTKYEVQVLENGAGRIFQSKVSWFERNLVEPLINDMLASCIANMGEHEPARISNTEPVYGTKIFQTVTKEDLKGTGKLMAVGARHFAEQARFVQELTQTIQALENIATVKPHISGIQVSKALEDALGWEKYRIVQPYVAIHEQMEGERVLQAAQEQVGAEAAQPSELQPTDFVAPEEADEIGPDEAQAEGLFS